MRQKTDPMVQNQTVKLFLGQIKLQQNRHGSELPRVQMCNIVVCEGNINRK